MQIINLWRDLFDCIINGVVCNRKSKVTIRNNWVCRWRNFPLVDWTVVTIRPILWVLRKLKLDAVCMGQVLVVPFVRPLVSCLRDDVIAVANTIHSDRWSQEWLLATCEGDSVGKVERSFPVFWPQVPSVNWLSPVSVVANVVRAHCRSVCIFSINRCNHTVWLWGSGAWERIPSYVIVADIEGRRIAHECRISSDRVGSCGAAVVKVVRSEIPSRRSSTLTSKIVWSIYSDVKSMLLVCWGRIRFYVVLSIYEHRLIQFRVGTLRAWTCSYHWSIRRTTRLSIVCVTWKLKPNWVSYSTLMFNVLRVHPANWLNIGDD